MSPFPHGEAADAAHAENGLFDAKKDLKIFYKKIEKNSCNLHKTHVYYYLLWHDSYEA